MAETKSTKKRAYTLSDIDRLEAKKKALQAELKKAKLSVARKEASKQRKERTHQLIEIGADICNNFDEKYINIFRYISDKNKHQLQDVLERLVPYYEKIAEKKQSEEKDTNNYIEDMSKFGF